MLHNASVLLPGDTGIQGRFGGQCPGPVADVPGLRIGAGLRRFRASDGPAINAVPHIEAVPLPGRHGWNR